MEIFLISAASKGWMKICCQIWWTLELTGSSRTTENPSRTRAQSPPGSCSSISADRLKAQQLKIRIQRNKNKTFFFFTRMKHTCAKIRAGCPTFRCSEFFERYVKLFRHVCRVVWQIWHTFGQDLEIPYVLRNSRDIWDAQQMFFFF